MSIIGVARSLPARVGAAIFWWIQIDGPDWGRRAWDYAESLIFHRHNARVITDFEHRMACVLCECTNGMSKPYYDIESMRYEINDYHQELRDDAGQDAVLDFIDSLPDDCVPDKQAMLEDAGLSHIYVTRCENERRMRELMADLPVANVISIDDILMAQVAMMNAGVPE